MADIGFNLDHAAQRAGLYWGSDGLPTIANGLTLLLMGSGMIWFHRQHLFHPQHLLWRSLMVLGLFIAYVYFFAMPNSPAMRWLKGRITYPRTGYVAFPPSGSVASTRAIRSIHVEAWLVFATSISYCDTPWIATLPVIIATSILWWVIKGRFPSAGILIPGFYLSGLLIPFLPVAPNQRPKYFFMVYGLIFLFAGIVRLVGYLRRHPVVHA